MEGKVVLRRAHLDYGWVTNRKHVVNAAHSPKLNVTSCFKSTQLGQVGLNIS